MDHDPIKAAKELVDTLDHAAMYNDKGYLWSRHSAAQLEQERASFQASLEELAARIGAERLGPALQDAIESGAAASDPSGDMVNLARRTLRQLEGVH